MTKVLNFLQENMMLTRLNSASADSVKDAFFANYLASMVILKLQDIQGLHLINDHAGSNDIKSFNSSMSDVNFWSRILFNPTNPVVKQRLAFGQVEVLDKEAGRISDSVVKKIMKLPLQAPDSVNWPETVAILILLKHRFSVNSTYARNLISYLYRWDNFLSGGLKKRAMNDAFMYLLQSDPKSSLLPRMRALSNGFLLKAADSLSKTIVGFKRINEEDGGGEGGEATGTGNIGSGETGNNIVTPIGSNLGLVNQNGFDSKKKPKKKRIVIKDGKIVKKRVKGFKPRKFKLPDFLRSKNNPDIGDTAKTTFKNFDKE